MRIKSIENNKTSCISLKGMKDLYGCAKQIGYKIYDEQASIKSARNNLALGVGVNIKNNVISLCNNIRDSFSELIR